MKKPFKLRRIPVDFGDRFPDGDYTVGRGADPRGLLDKPKAKPATAVRVKKSRNSKSRKRIVSTAAE